MITCICELPRRLKCAQTKTACEILDECNALAQLDLINSDDIKSHLSRHPELINDWLCYSEDQRCTPANCFIEINQGYTVARYPGGVKMVFDDRASACTEFIIRQLDRILDLRKTK
ncbi:MAG: hypothetical protein AB7G28_24435 [Pirellulales bacterium]